MMTIGKTQERPDVGQEMNTMTINEIYAKSLATPGDADTADVEYIPQDLPEGVSGNPADGIETNYEKAMADYDDAMRRGDTVNALLSCADALNLDLSEGEFVVWQERFAAALGSNVPTYLHSWDEAGGLHPIYCENWKLADGVIASFGWDSHEYENEINTHPYVRLMVNGGRNELLVERGVRLFEGVGIRVHTRILTLLI